jgi:hypothetical protein
MKSRGRKPYERCTVELEEPPVQGSYPSPYIVKRWLTREGTKVKGNLGLHQPILDRSFDRVPVKSFPVSYVR